MNIVTIDGPNGRPIMGSYVVKDGWVTVRSTKLGAKRAQLHASTAEALAKLLLGELWAAESTFGDTLIN